ncbi:fatty acid desaturase [Pseudomonas sp. ANT_J12]|uniref:fatty acid desaturase family protein n=1 Tax=Pseudomonas sp. ANT_J12 TaxID=2597351 RepID=UPI0011F2EE06|nr:fatty acid desaturase family protein [Pseudomonas sp. ANT_J12]KAA0985947.1 fatty acid desaturase [Pseudomonas sp. ANT_J12]
MSRPSSRAGDNPALNAYTLPAEFFALKPWLTLLALLADWGLIAASLAAAALWPHPVTYLLAAIIIARSQLALAVIMHESAHGVVVRHQGLNDVIGQLFAAGPLFLSLHTYRAGHLKHHLAPMRHDDPVVAVFGLGDFPLPRGKLAAKLLADLCGVGYFISAGQFARGDYRDIMPKVDKSPRRVTWEVFSMLASNGLLLGVLAWSGHAWLYPALWLLPAITLLPFMGRIRAIMEHAGLPACDDQSQNARSIVRSNWQTFVFGPHAIHYHIEHHLFVRVPFYHLRSVHQQLVARQLVPTGNLYNGYIGVLRDVSLAAAKMPAA